jgi:hypothetical protein
MAAWRPDEGSDLFEQHVVRFHHASVRQRNELALLYFTWQETPRVAKGG